MADEVFRLQWSLSTPKLKWWCMYVCILVSSPSNLPMNKRVERSGLHLQLDLVAVRLVRFAGAPRLGSQEIVEADDGDETMERSRGENDNDPT